MKAIELKLCLAMAQDQSVDTSDPALQSAFDSMCGFGLPGFSPVEVPLLAVVKMLRWQCQCFDGTWDWAEYAADKPGLLRNVNIAEMTKGEAAGLVAEVCGRVMAQ